MRRILSLTLMLALVAAAGCGRGAPERMTHDEYLTALRQIELSPAVRDADRRFSQLAAGAVTAEGCRSGARQFADDVQSIVDAVDRLEPPRDAEGLQRRFLSAAGRTAALLDELADDVAAGRVACGMPWNRRAYGLPSTAEAGRVLADYARRGYTLNWNSGD